MPLLTGAPPVAPAIARWAPSGAASPRLTAEWADVFARDPWLRHAALVVDLAPGGLSGRSIRVATRPVPSATSRGERRDAVPGLVDEPDLSSEVVIGEPVGAARQITISVSADLLSPAEWLSATGTLCGIAEVALERTDREALYEERLVLLRGEITDAQFGASGEIVTLTIADPRASAGSPLPPWVVDSERFSDVHETGIGAAVPIVVNSARRVPCVRVTSTGKGQNSWIACYGTATIEESQGELVISGKTPDPTSGVNSWELLQGADAAGTPYTGVRFTNAGKKWSDSDNVYADVSEVDPELRAQPPDALRRVLSDFTALGRDGVSAECFGAAAALWPSGLGAPQVMINAGGGGVASAIDWAENGFLVSYPMLSGLWTGGAYGIALIDARLPPVHVLHAETFPVLGRASDVEDTATERITEVVVSWGWDPYLDSYAGVVVRDVRTSAVAGLGSVPSPGARRVIESPTINDAATAAFVAEWVLAHFALGSFTVAYDVVPAFALLLRPGDAVRLTDTETHPAWSSVPAVIQRVTRGPGRAEIVVRVFPFVLGARGFGAGSTS